MLSTRIRYGYGGPAGLRLFSEIDKLGQEIGQGEIDGALLRALNNVAGVLFHYPAGQVQRTAEGKTMNPAALVVGPAKE